MSDKPERIWAVAEDLGPHFYGETYWETAPTIAGTPYVREDLHGALQGRVQFLEKALEQAVSATALTILTPREYEDDYGRVHDLPEGLACAHLHLRGIDDYPELAQYLKEKTEG